MKSATRNARTCLAFMLLGAAMGPAHAADHRDMKQPCMSFSELDADRNGYLSMEEFQAKGKDDLAFRAADIDGDERIDPDEFDKYVSKANKAGSGAGAGIPQPTQAPSAD